MQAMALTSRLMSTQLVANAQTSQFNFHNLAKAEVFLQLQPVRLRLLWAIKALGNQWDYWQLGTKRENKLPPTVVVMRAAAGVVAIRGLLGGDPPSIYPPPPPSHPPPPH